MSLGLVDYASSSDDESDAEQHHKDEQSRNPNEQPHISEHPPPPPSENSGSSSSDRRPGIAPARLLPTPAFEKLPDASVLLNSTSMPVVPGTDHASRVAAAMAESASRKRDSNGVASTVRHRKLPRGSLPNSKDVQDTSGGLLLPPQLRGRSNVVTEDISKLFVRRAADPSSSVNDH